MIRAFAVSVALSALALGSCGGGGDSKPPVTGTSSPTPTPSPTSAITYTKFADISTNQAFKAGCGGIFGISEVFDAFGFGRADTVTLGVSIDYQASSQSYRFRGRAYDGTPYDYTFDPTLIQTTNAPANTTYYRKANADGSVERFYLGRRPLGSFQPEYVRTALLNYRNGSGPPEVRDCVFGVPTTLEDTRPSQTVSYNNAAVAGYVFVDTGSGLRQYTTGDSTVTISANPNSGEIPVTLKLAGREVSAAGESSTVTQLGEYRGTASVDGSVQSFNAAFTDGDRAILGGNFAGWFFGPQGIEIGFGWSIKSQFQDGSVLTGSGTVTARR